MYQLNAPRTWILVLGSVIATLIVATAQAQQSQTITLWASSVPFVDGWDHESVAAGDPGCTEPCASCNSDTNPTYAVNAYPQAPASRTTAWLTASNFQTFTLPAGACVTGLQADALVRYDDGDDGQLQIQMLGTDFDSGVITTGSFSNTTNCRFQPRTSGDFTGPSPETFWTADRINSLQFRVRRVLDSNNTNLRIKAFRLRVTVTSVTAPTSISPTYSPVCPNGTVTLTALGGAGSSMEWFTGSCGGQPIGNGSTSITVTVASPTRYFARWVGACGASSCASIDVGVAYAVPPTAISASAAEVCAGAPVTLTAIGGSGSQIKWFANGCDGNLLEGNAPTLVVHPTATTVYFARWETECNNASTPPGCASVIVHVRPASIVSPITYTRQDRNVLAFAYIPIWDFSHNYGPWHGYAWSPGSTMSNGSASVSQVSVLGPSGIDIQSGMGISFQGGYAESSLDVAMFVAAPSDFALTGQMDSPPNFPAPYSAPVRLIELIGPGTSVVLSGAYAPEGNGPGVFSRNGLLMPGSYRFRVIGGTYRATPINGGMSEFHANLLIRPRPCNPADVAGLGGSGGSDGQLTADDIGAYLTAFFANDVEHADLTGLGGIADPDGRVTPDDLIEFLRAFFDGCPAYASCP